MIDNKYDSAPTSECRTYELNGVTYVPHYLYQGIFVGPGGRQIGHESLRKELGAKPSTARLWTRTWAIEQGLQKQAA